MAARHVAVSAQTPPSIYIERFSHTNNPIMCAEALYMTLQENFGVIPRKIRSDFFKDLKKLQQMQNPPVLLADLVNRLVNSSMQQMQLKNNYRKKVFQAKVFRRLLLIVGPL